MRSAIERQMNRPIENDAAPAGIDFSEGVRGLHHIPASGESLPACVHLPASIEKSAQRARLAEHGQVFPRVWQTPKVRES